MRRTKRGAFLAQTTILVILVVFVATLILKLVLGRATIVNRTITTQEKKYAAQAVQSRINSCLAEGSNPFGKNNCSAGIPVRIGQPGSYADCFKGLPGIDYEVRVKGNPPACTFEIDIKD